MNPLIIEKTDSSLGVEFNNLIHELNLHGESRPENAPSFFINLNNWLDNYKDYLKSINNKIEIRVNCEIDYFNSTSAKFLLDFFLKLKTFNTEVNHVEVIVNWFYKSIDEDILECGEEFQDLSKLKFNLIPKD